MRPIDYLYPARQGLRSRGLCTTCGEPCHSFRDPLSRKEYGISGMCQQCQDSVFRSDTEDDLVEQTMESLMESDVSGEG
jgi:hypothetical protein